MLRTACGASNGAQQGFNDPSTVFPIETEAFSGKMFFRVRHLEGEPREYFAGKNRMLSVVVQGRVKRQISMGDCFTGYEFARPFRRIPAKTMISAAMAVIRRLAPTVSADVVGKKPYFLNPLFQTIQLLNVSLPGEEPDLTAYPLAEQTGLLGGIFAQRAVDWQARKKYFASAANGRQHMLQPEHVYTMEFYEDKLDMSTFQLAVLGMRFDLSRYLDGQPLQIMGKIGSAPHSTDYLFNVEMWHERLARDAESADATPRPISPPEEQQQPVELT